MSWQATRMPRAESEAKKDLAMAEAAFHRAMLASDVKTLESLTDESFVWIPSKTGPLPRKQMLELIGSGQLKYSRLETTDVTVQLYGDTGIVRGMSTRQHSSIPGAGAQNDATPITTFYTLTFIFADGEWKAVAMHSNQPATGT